MIANDIKGLCSFIGGTTEKGVETMQEVGLGYHVAG